MGTSAHYGEELPCQDYRSGRCKQACLFGEGLEICVRQAETNSDFGIGLVFAFAGTQHQLANRFARVFALFEN